MAKLYERSATELAALIASREVSSREVVEAHLSRIAEVNGYVNAITVVLSESARAAADAADRTEISGPLHGVPFTVKENIDCLDSATTHGVPRLEKSMPFSDAPIVARMKAAGAIPIGRTNLPEFGLRLSTDNPLRGRTLNPWSPHVTAGGSSGGEAAALATGMTPIGLGNDLGGSLRNPAFCCGVAALKPTMGRVPCAGSIPPLDFGFALQAMMVEGPMARSVADLRLGLSILAGRDRRDPRSVDAPLQGPAPAECKAALVTHIPGVELAPVIVSRIERAGEILARAGWRVEQAAPPELDKVNETWGRIISTDYQTMLPRFETMLTRPVFEYMMRVCHRFDTAHIPNWEIHATRSRLTRLWSAFFAEYPVVIGPTWTQPPWPYDADLQPQSGLALVLDTVRFITPANVLGFPALALPMGTVERLPTGIQIYADLWREDLCLAAAEIIEREVGRPAPIDPIW
jgi:amidase